MKRVDEYLETYKLSRAKGEEIHKKLMVNFEANMISVAQKLEQLFAPLGKLVQELEADEEDATDEEDAKDGEDATG